MFIAVRWNPEGWNKRGKRTEKHPYSRQGRVASGVPQQEGLAGEIRVKLRPTVEGGTRKRDA